MAHNHNAAPMEDQQSVANMENQEEQQEEEEEEEILPHLR